MAYLHDSSAGPAPAGLAGFGWSTQLRQTIRGRPITIGQEGHEVITRDAIGGGAITFTLGGRPVSARLSGTDIADIILGNRSVDLGTHDADDSGAGVRAVLNPGEQKRHSLRSTIAQSTPAALADIRAEFARQHGAILAERDLRRRMRRIGVTLHLIQDSFSPAHTARDSGRGWCLQRVRNYGPSSRLPFTDEHGFPTDPRDSVIGAGTLGARMQATLNSRRYLQIVLKAIHGITTPDPAASAEAAAEVGRFAADIFRAC